jgi:hypothetical protein
MFLKNAVVFKKKKIIIKINIIYGLKNKRLEKE